MPTQGISSHFLRHHFTWIYTLMPSHKIFLELPWKNYIQQGGKFQNERIIKNFLSAVTCKRYTSKISWWTNNVFFSVNSYQLLISLSFTRLFRFHLTDNWGLMFRGGGILPWNPFPVFIFFGKSRDWTSDTPHQFGSKFQYLDSGYWKF